MWYEQLANNNQLVFKEDTYSDILGKAIFNKNETRRYFLEKRWEEGDYVLTAIMMNPSKAAHNQTDDTVDQLIAVAKNQGCHALYVVNVSSTIDGSSSNLNNAHFIFESINWNFVSKAMTEANIVFLGWGVKGHRGMLKHQQINNNLVNAFKNILSKMYCYDVLKSNDKKFTDLYYVPHPRPLFKREKYRNMPIRQISEVEFTHLFIK